VSDNQTKVKHSVRLCAASLLGMSVLLAGCDSGSKGSDAAKPVASAASIARGRYLATAADCISCHSEAGKGAFSGGYAIETPYGFIYGSNITPDKETGIGRYTRDDLYRVLHSGKRPNGSPLYPAMPYISYQLISREDSDAIYDYLMAQPAIKHANKPLGFGFPFNLRWSMLGWQLLYLHAPDFPPANSAETRRGAYLANGLAHCAECHTPRNVLGALKQDAFFKGAMIGRYEAPDITPAALSQRGWTQKDLAALLSSGLAPQGSAYADMFPAVHNSTRYLTPSDINSLVRYISGPNGLAAPAPVKAAALSDSVKHNGLKTYANLCANCHGFAGEGKPHVAPAMVGNSSLRLASAHNLLVTLLSGVAAQQFGTIESMQAMPGMPKQVSDQEVADLANTLRAQWGGQAPSVTADDVSKLRSSHAN